MSQNLVLAAAISVCLAPAAGAQIDPRGVFFHNYTGPFSGFEWIQIVDQPGADRYQFSDLRGAVPYAGTITPDGTTTWDTTGTTSGSGAFANENRATFTLGFQGQNFTSDIWRAPFTDADFLTTIESRETGDASLNGTWNVVVQSIDPQTGAITDESSDTLTVAVTDDLMRVTMSSGVHYQGVFEDADRVGFRVQRRSVPAAFQTYAGSEYSVNINLLGDLCVTGADAFEAVMLTEQRGTGGNLRPEQIRLLATRVPAPGVWAPLACAGVLSARRRRTLS
ncbi:MAG: hypothetical protein DHS20C14_21650 [Phycisphaeraceae bacterium]|nr:MAG: hypothetical protein DHS20C14_21650 [Phycisphaeraceae bacterium]